jgi:hypothetical protein
METIQDLTELTDIISIGAEYDEGDNEVVLYVTTPEVSVSLNFERGEWDDFYEKLTEINDKLPK